MSEMELRSRKRKPKDTPVHRDARKAAPSKRKRISHSREDASSVDRLPNEMIHHVLAFLSPAMKAIARSVCRNWFGLLFVPPSAKGTSRVPLRGKELWTALAREGHLSCIVWLNEQIPPRCHTPLGCTFGRPDERCTITKAAARRGHLDVLRWLRRAGFPLDRCTAKAAARGGHVNVLRWLKAKGCKLGSPACHAAAKEGQLHALKWLRRKDCKLNSFVFDAAARNGHLDVLRWLKRNGCPWSFFTCHAAAEKRQPEVLRWLLDEGCEWDHDFWLRQDSETWRWCRDNGLLRNRAAGRNSLTSSVN